MASPIPLEADAAEEHARLALEVRDKLATALRAGGHAVLLDKEGSGWGIAGDRC